MSKQIKQEDLIAFWTDPANQDKHLEQWTAEINVEHGVHLKKESLRQRLYKIRADAEKAGFEVPPIPKSMVKRGRPASKRRVPPAYKKYFSLKKND